MVPKKNPRRSLVASQKGKIPSFAGWIIVLLVIEEATLGKNFFFLAQTPGSWNHYFLSLAFLLSLGLSVILHSRIPFPDWLLSLLGLIILGVSFAPLGPSGIYWLRLVFALVSGCAMAPFGIDFFMGFNNRQKGWALLVAFGLGSTLFLLQSYEPYLSLFLSGLGLLFLFLRTPSQQKPVSSLPLETVPEWWLLVLSFVTFILSGSLELSFYENLLTLVPQAAYSAFGGALVGVLFGLLFLKNRHFLMTFGLYLSFLFSAIGGLGLFFSPNTISLIIASLFLAAAHTLGLFSLYYVLGVYTRKYKNALFYGFGAVLSAIAYCFSLLLSLLAPFSFTTESRHWPVLFIAIPLLLFVLMPGFFQRQNQKEWLSDLSRDDVTTEDSLSAFFNEKRLSKREQQVARLLLRGLTLRQISAELNLSYPTVNTHQTAIYRKLGINSRAELLLLIHPLVLPDTTH
jgi:DNA-binding CsgD family transcriptional regulator